MKINDEVTERLQDIMSGECIQLGNDFNAYWIRTDAKYNGGDIGCVNLKSGELKVFNSDSRATVFNAELKIKKR